MSAPAPHRQAIDAYVGTMSALIALPIDPTFRASVAEHLARLLAAAALVEEFPLSDDVEVASVFRP